jgi:sugar diacid utilization regulator
MSADEAIKSARQDDALDVARRLRGTYAAMVDAVVGDDGLRRVAEIAGAAAGGKVAIAIPRLGPPALSTPDVSAADLLALTSHVGDRLRNRPSRVPDCVVAEVPVRSGERTMGLVVLLSESEQPALGAEFLHLAATVAVTKLAIEEARDEVELGLRDTLLEELRSSAPLSSHDIVRRASRFGCDLSGGAVALCADGDPNRPRRTMAMIAARFPGALAQALDGRIYALLPAVPAEDSLQRTLALAGSVAGDLRPYGAVGVSSFCEDPSELRRALAEAELMADVVRHAGEGTGELIGTGVYRLLLRLYVTHPGDVRAFHETTVGPLVAYDAQYGTDLLRTLESYLEHNCNMNATAVAVFAHRHTVAYRLERIRELTGLDPARSDDRERLGLGIKAHRILAPSAEAIAGEGRRVASGTARRRNGRQSR